jgi:DNA-binding beta-propeller fold protein YncE
MTIKLGDGQFIYAVDVDWAKFPAGWSPVDITDVAVDSKDRVYMLTRGSSPVTVFDRDGNLISTWGKGVFVRPHGLTVFPDDTLCCTDDGDHTVKRFTTDGRLLMTLGVPGKPSSFQSGRPFNGPTKVALDRETGNFYVADGYGNSSVHKFSADGTHLLSWGEVGTDEGQFNIVHSVCTDLAGNVYVADRENHRIQLFNSQGTFLRQWSNIHRPTGFYIDNTGSGTCFVGELPPSLYVNKMFPNLGARISIYNLKGERLARLGDTRPGEEPHQFWAPHGIAMDSHGDLYIAEVSYSVVGRFMDPPRQLRSFRKLIKVL